VKSENFEFFYEDSDTEEKEGNTLKTETDVEEDETVYTDTDEKEYENVVAKFNRFCLRYT
jgi:hypothetical protein